jgi:DNA-binding CsgD family transcriptional regulator
MALDWATRWGLGKAATATAIHSPSGEFMVLHLQGGRNRSHISKGDTERLNLLRPHIGRAALLTSRWRLEQMRIAAEAIALIGLPALILTRRGQVLAANKLIEEMSGYVRWQAKDRVALCDPAADRMFRSGMVALNSGSAAVTSFAARSGQGVAPVVAHLIPTPGQARDLFDGALAVLVLTPVMSPGAPDLTLIRGLFDLTTKEAEVARGITEGLSTHEIANRQGVEVDTIRSQVKSVLAKLGVRSRVEASSLLRGVPKLPLTEV